MNIIYFIKEALIGIVKRPLSFLSGLFIFIIPVYFLGMSFFLYREGREILKLERTKWGNFLVGVDSDSDIKFLKEQIKSIKEIKELKDGLNAESGKIIFQADLNIDIKEKLKIEEVKRTISDLKGVKFVQYQVEEIEYLENKNSIFAISGIILGIVSLFFVVKYIHRRFRKECKLNSSRIKILELAGASPSFTHSAFIIIGFISGLAAGFLALLILRVSMESLFLSSQLQFFMYPSTFIVIVVSSSLFININYYLAVKAKGG